MADQGAKGAAGSASGEEGVNVQVLLRCRPLSEREIVDRVPQVITCNDALREATLFQNVGGKQMTRTFRFDKVFGCDSTQEKLYKQAIVPIVQEVMEGFNCTIFAYGQTGTGKTYTMEGGPRQSDDGRKLSAQAGVIPRSIKQIFDTIEANNIDSTVKVTFLELYNEELTDLLSFEDDSKKLRLLEDRSGVVVQGLEEAIVRSAAEIYQVLDRGTAKRRTAATLLNNRSSRSHSIFTVTIHMKETTPEGEDVIKIGKLNLVDLAGSENISRSGAKDGRAREAGSINQSLLTLGRVITALVEHSGHVPYRDSKLTRLLRDSLGGRTKTCIIATIAPTVQCQEETISTLDYAHRAKNIRNRPELNQKISKTTMIKELATEIEKLRLDLCATREKNGVYMSMERYEQNEVERAQLREQVKALRAELELEEKTHTEAVEAAKVAHEQEVQAMQAELASKQRELDDTQDKLNEANVTIGERQFIILSHQRAQHAMAVHAEQLNTELAACASDLTALFVKMEQLVALQGSDREVLRNLSSGVSQRLEQLSSAVASTLGTQAQRFAALTSDLGAYRAQKERDIAQLRDQVGGVQTNVRALQKALAEQLRGVAGSATSALEAAASHTNAYAAEAAAAAQAAEAAASGAINSLVQALEAQAQELQAVARTHASAAEASLKAVKEMADAAGAQFQGLADAATSMQSSSGARAAALDGALASFQSTFESSLQAQQTQLMQQVTSLVAAFSAQQQQAVAAAVGSLKAQVGKDAAAAAGEAGAMASAAAAALSGLHTARTSTVQGMEQAAAASTQGCGTVATALQQAGAAGAAAGPQVAARHAEQRQRLEAYAKATCQGAQQAAAGVQQAAAAAAAQAESAAGEVVQAQEAVLASANGQHAADVAAAESLAHMVTEAAEAMQSFGSQHRSAVGDLSISVSSTVSAQLSRQLPDTGREPARRPLSVPPVSALHELMCPPEDVILQNYRREKQAILKRGGDARYVALLLSPKAATAASPSARVPPSPFAPAALVAGANENSAPATTRAPSASLSKIPSVASSKQMAIDGEAGARTGLVDRTNN